MNRVETTLSEGLKEALVTQGYRELLDRTDVQVRVGPQETRVQMEEEAPAV